MVLIVEIAVFHTGKFIFRTYINICYSDKFTEYSLELLLKFDCTIADGSAGWSTNSIVRLGKMHFLK